MGNLTTFKVRHLIKAGRYGDGDGLWLQVRDADRKSWLFRSMLRGKAREMGLLATRDVTLAEARAAVPEPTSSSQLSADYRRFHFLHRTATVLSLLEAA